MMSLEYTRKGKIGITIISIWLIVSSIFAIGGIMLMLSHIQSNVDMNQVVIDYYIAIGGLLSIMFGTMIIFGFSGTDAYADWYEWKDYT